MQKKSKNNDCEEDEEDSEESEEEDYESNEDEEEEQYEEKCPSDFDPNIWDRMLDLRDQRLDEEEKILEIQKSVDVFYIWFKFLGFKKGKWNVIEERKDHWCCIDEHREWNSRFPDTKTEKVERVKRCGIFLEFKF